MQQENPKVKTSEQGQLVTCIECGKSFPPGEVLRFGELCVCADCKPAFQQKLAEGSFKAGNLDFASVGRRFAAVSLDGLIVWFAFFIIGVIGYLVLGKGSMGQGMSNLGTYTGPLLSLAMSAAYMILFIGKLGATPGKMALGIKVVRATGAPLGIPLAAGRYFSTYISGFTLGIGYLMAFFDSEKRTLHDRICGTRVIRD